MESNQILNAFSYLSIWSSVVPIACYILAKKKGQAGKDLFMLLLTSLAFDIGNEIYVRAGFRGYLILNIYFVIQVILLSQICALLLNSKKVIYSVLAVFLGFCISNTIYFQSINDYQSFNR